MNAEPNNILNICLEIEGLLCLLERRGDAAHKSIVQLLRSKASAMDAAVEELAARFSTHEDICPAPIIVPEIEDTTQLIAEEPSESIELDFTPDAKPVMEQMEPEIPEPIPTPTEEVPGNIQEQIKDVIVAPEAPKSTAVNDSVPIKLSINDKFRFRKELFANSDKDLTEALQIAATMQTLEEAEDYFYNDLCFDPENEVVKDFMRVVASHF